MNIDLGKIDLSDESLCDGGTLKTYKDAAIAYGRAVKSNGENQESLKAEFKNAKDGLLLKMVKKLLRKWLKKNQARRQVLVFPYFKKKQKQSSSTPPSSSQSTPSTSPAPSASSLDKFQFPSVPEGP